ncbi:MAG: FAD:protein FMN transferase [Gammaproteobacteria bacterium]|nr:FAD:protein FMN transferase [Gammaproteobacteria bacterium]
MRLPAVLTFALLVTLAACTPATGPYEERIYVFGTLVDVTLAGVTAEQGRQAVAELAKDFREEHREWHAWQPGPLTELNAAIARGEPGRATPHLRRLIEISQRLSEQSDGLFDPAIGGLVRLWGFHSDDPLTGKPPPSAQAIAEWVEARPRMSDLVIDGDTVRSRSPKVMLDFGAIAKGYAVDLAVEKLRAMGVANAIVNAGGGMTAIGQRADRPWRVGVRHPQGKGVLAAIELRRGHPLRPHHRPAHRLPGSRGPVGHRRPRGRLRGRRGRDRARGRRHEGLAAHRASDGAEARDGRRPGRRGAHAARDGGPRAVRGGLAAKGSRHAAALRDGHLADYRRFIWFHSWGLRRPPSAA